MRKYKFCQFLKNIPARIYKLFNCAKIKGEKVRGAQNLMGLKTHRQISKEQCFEKYCSSNKACQFSDLQGTPRRSYLENPTIDDKLINKRVRLFIHQTCV